MIAPDDKQLMTGRSIPPRRIIVDAAVGHVDALDNRIPYRSAALDDAPAHNRQMAIDAAADKR
jgi:hypothetical protein